MLQIISFFIDLCDISKRVRIRERKKKRQNIQTIIEIDVETRVVMFKELRKIRSVLIQKIATRTAEALKQKKIKNNLFANG